MKRNTFLVAISLFFILNANVNRQTADETIQKYIEARSGYEKQKLLKRFV